MFLAANFPTRDLFALFV